MVQAKRTSHTPSEEILTRQRLVSVALGQHEADLVLEGATLLNSHTLTWKEDWDIVIQGQRIAWVRQGNAPVTTQTDDEGVVTLNIRPGITYTLGFQ